MCAQESLDDSKYNTQPNPTYFIFFIATLVTQSDIHINTQKLPNFPSYILQLRPPALGLDLITNTMPNTIFKEAWSKIREITNDLEDHKVVNKMIEEALKIKLKYTKKIVSRDKMVYLKRNRIGTSRIESLAKQVEGCNRRNPNTVAFIVEKQLIGMNKDINTLKANIFTKDKIIKQHLSNHWRIEMYTSLWKAETNRAWHNLKQEATRSRQHLHDKFKHNNQSHIVKQGDIEVRLSEDLNDELRLSATSDQNIPVSLGVDITQNEKLFLSLPQHLSDHTTFDRIKALTDTALMGTKYRMSTLSRLKTGLTVEQHNDRTSEQKESDIISEVNSTKVYDYSTKTASFSNMRVTSMKTCRRVKITEPLPEQEEAQIQSVISAVEKAINLEASRNKSMRIKTSTLTKSEALGLKSLKKRTKNGQAAIVATDKSGKLSVIDKINYDRLVSEHTSKDQIINEDEVVRLETVLSATSSSLARVLKIGNKWNQQDRVQSAAKSTLSSVPPLAILLKDHKPGPNKPVRPLCRSSESPNGPLSEITSDVMCLVANELNSRQKTEVKSTEEMCAILDNINETIEPDYSCFEQCGTVEQDKLSEHNLNKHPDTLPQIVIGSMDVKALYPSLDIDHSSSVIDKLIRNSQVNFDVDVLDMALHIAATNTQLQIDKLGLSEVIHTRKHKNGPRPLIISKTVTGTETERETQDSWIPPSRTPTIDETKQMLALVISQAVTLVMRSHVYTNSDTIWKQLFGGAIGIRATCEVAKLVMLEHDRILWQKVAEAGIEKVDSGRYVDDENPTFRPVPFGARLINGKVTVQDQYIQSDKLIPHDKRTFDIVLEIANSIWSHIQFTMEVPSESPTGFIPVLDMQVAINQFGQISRRFYSKPMNTPFTILARSAHSWQTKRSTLTQEGVRRMLNTSTNTPISVRNQILQEWDWKMNLSGYSKSFRGNVISSSIQIYQQKLLTAQQGGQPVHRPSGWEAAQRDMNKHINTHTWYHGKSKAQNQAPLIIDSTATGKLESDIKSILSEASRKSNINIKLVVRGGRKISKNAPSDPFASRLCSRDSCKVCTSVDSKGGCKQASIGYTLSCDPCAQENIEATYQGESSKSAYERGMQHSQGLLKKAEDNPIWKHSQLHHGSDNKIGFNMQVTGRFSKPMIRQENEAIRIRESQAVHEMNSRSEYHQPVIIRLVPTSSNSQADQTGAPAVIMDPRNYNKRKASTTRRPDSPNVEPRSKHSRSNYSEIQTVSSTRQSRRESYDSSRQHSRYTHQSPTIQTHTRVRSSSHHSQSKGDYYVSASRYPTQHKPYKQHNQPQHNTTHTTKQHTRNRTPPRVKFSKVSPLPAQASPHNKTPTHIEQTHVEDISLSPVSPESFSFAMRKLRSTGKFAYRSKENNTSHVQPQHSVKTKSVSTHTTIKTYTSTVQAKYDREGAISRSVMRSYPSTTDPNSYPHIPQFISNSNSPILPTYPTQTNTIDSDTLSQVSQTPLTQACNLLSQQSKVVAHITSNTKSSSTTSTKSNTSHTSNTHIPILPLELSVEFDTPWSGDEEVESTVTPVYQCDSLSQLRRDATLALRKEDLRVEQVKHALDNPITTLEGLTRLRERRRKEALNISKTPITSLHISTSNTVKNTLEPEKSKNSPKKFQKPTLSRKKVQKPKLISKKH